MNRQEDPQRGPTILATLLDRWIARVPDVGIATGFADLDRITDGLHRGELVVLGSRPSMGKTAFASQIAMNVAASGHGSVLYVSRQVTDTNLAIRMLGVSSGFDARRLRTGRLRVDEVARAIDRLRETRVVIDECPRGSVASIRAVARQVAAENGALALVIVDALQDVFDDPAACPDDAEDRSTVIRELGRLARELDSPVLALTNLDRRLERRANKRPLLSDLRGTGVVEEGADVVLFLYRDDVYDPESQDRGTAELIVARQRHGPIGSVRLSFAEESLRFDRAETVC